MYAKIENGQLKHAPQNIILKGMRIVNPSAEQYAKEGWFPLELTVIPSDRNKTATATYLEQDGKIVQSWTLSDTPAPEPTPEERIAVLEEELKAAKILLGLED